MSSFNISTSRQSTLEIKELERIARRVRATCVAMAYLGKESHLTSALSCTDILVALYGNFLDVSPIRLKDPHRDRFLFSKGHAVSAYYAVLADSGFLSIDELYTYAKSGSSLPNHPCKLMLPCLEISSGSLGHGLGMGTGIMYGMTLGNSQGRVVVLMSDGECNEGSVWESAAFACAHKQDRLIAIIDNNNMQAVGRTDRLMGGATFEDKFRSFGWAVRVVNGNNMSEVKAALDDTPFESGRPSAIIAKTVGGSGVSFMQDDTVWHYRVPSIDDLRNAVKEIGISPMLEVDL